MLLLFLGSCIIEDANVVVPANPRQVVVNSFLTPDSLIKANLTYSVNLDEPNEFDPVEDALVIIYENGLYLDTLIYKGLGNYFSSYFPKPLNKYRIEIKTNDGDLVTASSFMPEKPKIGIEKIELLPCSNSNFEYSDSFIITFNLYETPKGYDYWFGFLETANEGRCFPYTEKASFCPIQIMYSTDSRISKFNKSTFPSLVCSNKIVEEFDLEAYITKYSLMTDNGPISFITSSFKKDDYFLSAVAASDDYSKYYKSVISNLNYEYGKDENPFNSPEIIYSNISGGLGIFSCYNRVVIKIE